MNRPSLEQQRELRGAAVTDDSAALNVDSSLLKHVRGGQRRGGREVKTASRRRKRRRPVRQRT
jgi:hypothetical protein